MWPRSLSLPDFRLPGVDGACEAVQQIVAARRDTSFQVQASNYGLFVVVGGWSSSKVFGK